MEFWSNESFDCLPRLTNTLLSPILKPSTLWLTNSSWISIQWESDTDLDPKTKLCVVTLANKKKEHQQRLGLLTWVLQYSQRENNNQYPAAPGAVAPSRLRLKRISLNRERSWVDLETVLDLESWRSMRSAIRCQVVPCPNESSRVWRKLASCSLRYASHSKKKKRSKSKSKSVPGLVSTEGGRI